jgi:hypothetical protein
MIDLKRVKKVVVHTPCIDGLVSAMIALDALPDAEVVFCAYGSQQKELECEPGMLFIDFTPDPDRVQQYVDAGAIVLDHHVHAKELVERFGERGIDVEEPGASGAVLAFRHVWLPTFDKLWLRALEQHKDFDSGQLAELVGVRDTWFKESPLWNQALEMHAILEAFPQDYWLAEGGIGAALEALRAGTGKALVDKKAKTISEVVQRGLIRRNIGGRVWALSAVRTEMASDLAEAARGAGVDVLVNVQPYIEDGVTWYLVNLRSNSSLDVGALAKRFRGGGHRGAAGFRALAETTPIEFFAWLSTEASL